MARSSIKDLKKVIEEKDKEIIALKAELERKSTELDKIVKVSSSVVSQLASTEDLLNLVVTVVAELLNTKICSIMLVDEEKQELIIRATQSLDEEYKNKPNLKVNQGISGLTVKEGRPVIVSDVREDPGFVYGDIARRLSLVSMLSVPMRFRNKVIGVINIYTSERHEFTTEEIEVVQALANYAGIAIGSSQLIEEVTKTREALETRKLIDRAKGFLMKSKGMSEDEAYRFLQKRSMDTGKPMKEIASAICLVYELEK
ncbi:MAG TPA: GAF and ANTAR domain-containing protein [bacterium]|nr:GAF and ANTAR domain-containing protein [bacterium]